MKNIPLIVLYAFAAMSFVAGVVKVGQMTQEVDLFAAAGLGAFPLVLLGLVQVSGGILSTLLRFRRLGLTLIIVGFVASVVVIAMIGDLGFAAFSMLPVLIGALLLFNDYRAMAKVNVETTQ